MRILLTKVGKRFNRDWIFRHLDYEFLPGLAYAITGPNGSGKSTLLQVIAGSTACSEGKVQYISGPTSGAGKTEGPPLEEMYSHISLAAPYLELIEEMTLSEFMQFHCRFKPFLPGIGLDRIADTVGLGKEVNKQIRYFSSGMKQRVKLAQAIFSDTPIVLLDEPCTNLDTEGISMYHQLIASYCSSRLVIVSSNDAQEYAFCRQVIDISHFK